LITFFESHYGIKIEEFYEIEPKFIFTNNHKNGHRIFYFILSEC